VTERLDQEHQLLKDRFGEVERDGNWFHIKHYPLAPGLWDVDEVQVAFSVPEAYPGQKPYGFYVTPKLKLAPDGNPTSANDGTDVPFPGEWLKFSWDQPEWAATANIQGGSNLLAWALSFKERLDDRS
jgi:hypothetical protein